MSHVGKWAGHSLIKYREDIVDGLHNVPEAFLGLFSGRNLGKLIVRVDPNWRPTDGGGHFPSPTGARSGRHNRPGLATSQAFDERRPRRA